MGKRLKIVSINLMVAAVALAVAFAVPEVLLRIIEPAFTREVFDAGQQILPGLQNLVTATERYEREHGIQQPANFIEASALLWSLVPGYRGDITRLPPLAGMKPTWRLEVNALGLRGEPPSERTDLFRVVCLGDSITFGDKLDQGDTFPATLARLLSERWPERRIEVINAGIPGYSSHQGIALWRRLRALRPAVVIVSFGQNDAWRAMVPDRESLPLGESLIDRARSQLRNTELYRALRAVLLAVRRRVAPPAGGSDPNLAGPRVPVEETSENVRTIVREARADGAEAIIVHTAFNHFDIAAALAAASRAEGVVFVNGRGLFDSVRARQQKTLAAELGLGGVCPDHGDVSSGYVFRVRFLEGTRPGGEIVASVTGAAPRLIRAPLADDGRGCDERMGDGLFTGLVEAPADRILPFVFGARSPEGTVSGEFGDFPLTWRVALAGRAETGGPRVGPVETYGRFRLMSEQVHPDPEGAAVLAAAIARVIR